MNNETKTEVQNQPLGQRRPKLAFFHANAKGTGCMMTMELHPAHDYTDGCIMMRVANQMTIGNPRGPNPTFARFDMENAMSVKLDFSDLCQILQVLRGECEAVGDGGKGLYHQTARALTKIVLRHYVEPMNGYSLEVYRTPSGGGDEMRTHMLLSPAEALGICEAISGAMYVISFGIPMLVPHDTSAYVAENRGGRNVVAA